MKFRKRIYILFVCIAATLLLIYCDKKEKENVTQGEQVNVVVSTAPQKEFAKEILGKRGKVTVMVPEGKSPHSYEPPAQKMQEIAKADIYFKVGSGIYFEKRYMKKIRDVNPKLNIVNGAKGIRILERDKHIWMAPRNTTRMVKNLLKKVVEINRQHGNYYRQNAKEYISELNKVHQKLKKQFKPFQGKEFLIYHPSLAYFANSYGIKQIPIQKQGKTPGTKELNRLIEKAKNKGIKTIFISPQFDKSNAKIIAKNIDGDLVMVNALASDYLMNLKKIARKLLESFKSRRG